MLTPDQVARYRERGFLVVPGFASAAECAALRRRGLELVDELDPAARRAATFSTKDQTNSADPYFLDSASRVGVFFEVGAVDAATGALGRPARAAANKLGHALHDVDPVFREFSRAARMASVLRALGYRRPLPVQASSAASLSCQSMLKTANQPTNQSLTDNYRHENCSRCSTSSRPASAPRSRRTRTREFSCALGRPVEAENTLEANQPTNQPLITDRYPK